MNKIIEATYQDGILMLPEKLSPSLEGKKVKIIVIENEQLPTKKQNFFRLASQHLGNLPENYEFNRLEIYDNK